MLYPLGMKGALAQRRLTRGRWPEGAGGAGRGWGPACLGPQDSASALQIVGATECFRGSEQDVYTLGAQ